MNILGVYDDLFAEARLLPPIRSYKIGMEQEVIETWAFVDQKERTPSSPYVCSLSASATFVILNARLYRLLAPFVKMFTRLSYASILRSSDIISSSALSS